MGAAASPTPSRLVRTSVVRRRARMAWRRAPWSAPTLGRPTAGSRNRAARRDASRAAHPALRGGALAAWILPVGRHPGDGYPSTCPSPSRRPSSCRHVLHPGGGRTRWCAREWLEVETSQRAMGHGQWRKCRPRRGLGAGERGVKKFLGFLGRWRRAGTVRCARARWLSGPGGRGWVVWRGEIRARVMEGAYAGERWRTVPRDGGRSCRRVFRRTMPSFAS